MQYFNVHSHVFTMSNAPKKFLHLYLPDWVANLIEKVTNTSAGAAIIEKLLSSIPWPPGKRYASFLKIGKSKNQLEVFETLIKQYDDETMKFVALTMYMEKCGESSSMSGFEGQIEEILMVKKQYPERLLIFFGVDPRWKYDGIQLRDTIKKYFDYKITLSNGSVISPFVGLKLYPSMGFYCFDERLKETFEWAEKNEIPVLSHCNYLGGIYNNDSNYIKGNLNPLDPYSGKIYSIPQYQGSGKSKGIFSNPSSSSNQNTCSYFLEPESYRTLLKAFPKLKLCLAHYGGAEHILNQHSKPPVNDPMLFGVVKENWCGQIQKLMQEFPNLYTDISYAVANQKTHDPIFSDLNIDLYQNRIMFGTDFFMTERESPEQKNYSIFKRNAKNFQLNNTITAWDQIAGTNVSRFLTGNYFP